MRGKAATVSSELKALGQTVKSLQSKRSLMYGKSLETTNAISKKLREVEEISQTMKDVQLWCFQMESTNDKANMDRMRGLSYVQIAKAGGGKQLQEQYGGK